MPSLTINYDELLVSYQVKLNKMLNEAVSCYDLIESIEWKELYSKYIEVFVICFPNNIPHATVYD